MGLYSDAKCITLNTKTKYTYDNFAAQYSDMDYTLDTLNSVYNDFRYCTSCVDYPTYQDGYFIGNDGTDDGDLINQCWKFYSHDSYNCDVDCVAMGSLQNSISWIGYAGKQVSRCPSSFSRCFRSSFFQLTPPSLRSLVRTSTVRTQEATHSRRRPRPRPRPTPPNRPPIASRPTCTSPSPASCSSPPSSPLLSRRDQAGVVGGLRRCPPPAVGVCWMPMPSVWRIPGAVPRAVPGGSPPPKA